MWKMMTREEKSTVAENTITQLIKDAPFHAFLFVLEYAGI